MSPNASAHQSLTEQAYLEIRSAIVAERIAPGTALMETKLSRAIGVSRTPTREALRRLELEGFLVRDDLNRLIVHSLSREEIRDLFEVRELLQSFAISLATERISDAELDELSELAALDERALARNDVERLAVLNRQIHDKIISASRNRILSEIVASLETLVHGFTAVAVGAPGDQQHFVTEHVDLINLIRFGDGEQASDLMRCHIRRARDLLLDGLEQ